MASINLLPWREAMRQEKKKEFLIQLAGIVGVAFLGCVAWVQAVDGTIDNQRERNQMLTTEIGLLDKQVEEIKDLKKRRQELEARMRVIQDLEGKRSVIVHYFDEFAKDIPDGVYFTSLQRRGDKFFIKGISESNQRISDLMRKLDASEWFTNPNLKSVVANPPTGEQSARFDLELNAAQPGQPDDAQGKGKPAGARKGGKK